MKQICRLDKTNKRPYCLRKPCSYKADGTCSGPVVAIQDYYGLHQLIVAVHHIVDDAVVADGGKVGFGALDL